MDMTVLSLCSGYEGTGLGLGYVPTWQAENDPHAATILATRYPDTPNLGDLTQIDWAGLGDVDLITAGYPCQPFSQAGARKGTDDDRHIWPWIAEAVRVLRPGLAFLENVAGHLSLGFGDVLGDLAGLGYDVRWCCVRASDVGAPHRRKRLFVLARAGATPDHQRRDSAEQDIATYQLKLESSRRDNTARLGVDDWWYATPDRARYAPAIERWSAIHGPAPHPLTDTNRLSPCFSEWMMGLPPGWVTDCDIPTTAKHKAIGNGQVPQAVRAAWLILTGQPAPWDTAPITGEKPNE